MSEQPTRRDPETIRRETGIDAPLEKKSKVERLKAESDGLRANILTELSDTALAAVSEDSYQLMKHFGMYQQDDRDVRAERRKAGLDKDHSFMIRTKVPGGILTADQYLLLDDIGTKYSKGGLRLTTRQTIQYHGVGKQRLQDLCRELNQRLVTTYGACGDVVRNTMSCPVIDLDPRPEWAGREVFIDLARQISFRTTPRTTAFYDIFIDGEHQKDAAPKYRIRNESEDLYGPTYLPRKFKIGIAIPQDNCVDVFTHDLGIVGLFEDGRLVGYNLLAGGGLGFTHGNAKTYPRLGSELAFVQPDEILRAVDAVISIQRDYGDRTDRKHSRLKYLLDEVGVEWFRAEMGRRLNAEVAPATPVPASSWQMHDHLGWHEQKQPGLLYVGVFIENGRVIDRPGSPVKSTLRRIVEKFRPEVRLTPQQNILFANIAAKHQAEIQAMLADVGLATSVNGKLSTLRRNEIACVALPTCGLALAESERAMPSLIDRLEELGYGNERISIRMSGCPNNCSRPSACEIGIMGCAPGKYNLFIGGSYEGTRLNQIFKEKVTFETLPAEIGRLIDRWRGERTPGESFGDWAHRTGLENLRN